MLPLHRIVERYNAKQPKQSIAAAIEKAQDFVEAGSPLPVEIHLKVRRTKQQSFTQVENRYKAMLKKAGIDAKFGLHVAVKDRNATEYIIHTYIQ